MALLENRFRKYLDSNWSRTFFGTTVFQVHHQLFWRWGRGKSDQNAYNIIERQMAKTAEILRLVIG
ncbi:hypothetical protein N692_12875 [Lactiplantibacillus plantarum EGD-AQ4]|nr:hypothetical protein N692_12875 [Lactiplantibacillus plantarum EGD-AQ4]